MNKIIYENNRCFFVSSVEEIESDIESWKLFSLKIVSDKIGVKPESLGTERNKILVEVIGFFPIENEKLVFKPSLIFKRVI